MKISKVLVIGLSVFALIGCKNPINSSNSSETNSQNSQQSSQNQGVGEQEKEFDFTRTVIFNSNGGTNITSQEIEEGKTVTKPSDPTKENYQFIGWYLDEQLYDFSSPVYFDITLEAKWELSSGLAFQKINFSNSLTIDGTKDNGPLTEGCLPSFSVSNKNSKILVFPVRLNSSYDSNTYDSYLDDINIAFNGTSTETGWESVKTYYQKSSYGKLNLDITVWGEWFYDSSINASYLQNLYDNYYNYNGDTDPNELLITKILDKYNSSINYSNYDSNGDNFIDSIWLIYDEQVDYVDESSMYWAYSSWDYEWYDESYSDYINPNKARDGVYPFYYAWAGIDFMYPNSNQADYDTTSIKIDSHTYIHETGHLLGLDDYYDYNPNLGPDRGLYGADMMDANIGDHGVISKLLLDWVDPYVCYGSGEFTLSSFTTTGDCILISDHNVTSLYDTYYLVEFYTNDGLNENDEPISNGLGIRITLVHAELNYVNGAVDFNGGVYETSFKYDNSDTSTLFVEMLSHTSFPSSGGYQYVSSANLFTEGKTFTSNVFDLQVVSVSSNEAVVHITLK